MLTPVDEIKNKLDIVEIVSAYIKLQKAGRNFKARCPFHSERTPSFFVSPERQIWHCFGCGKGGDIFGFVKEIEGIEFVDVLRLLAQKAGVILKKQDTKLASSRQRLYEICELAAKFFTKQLDESKSGKQIIKYLLERGLNKEIIAGWRLGYAPDDWHALGRFLKSRGYTDSEIIKSGLVVEQKQDGSEKNKNFHNYYDRFRNRIIFPIFDLNSQVIGFAGRISPYQKEKGISSAKPAENQAKYINSPQTLIYDKSRVLYGLDKAKMEIRQKDFCILVEGYTDVLMSHQAGFKNTVATCGTSLTEEQLRIIKRYTENLILAFDTDIAGDTATQRAIDLTILQGFNVKIIQPDKKLADEKDPADIIKEDPKEWKEMINDAPGVIEYYFDSAFLKYSTKEVSGKKQIAKIILPILKKIPDTIEQSHWVQELARRLQVPEKILLEAIKNIKERKVDSPKVSMPETTSRTIKSRRIILEEELFSLLLNEPEAYEKIIDIEKKLKESEAKDLFSEKNLREIFNSLKDYHHKHKSIKILNLKQWLSQLTSEQVAYVNQLLLNFEIKPIDKKEIDKHLKHCLRELEKEIIRQKLNQLQYEIRAHEENNIKDKLTICLQQFQKLSQKLAE